MACKVRKIIISREVGDWAWVITLLIIVAGLVKVFVDIFANLISQSKFFLMSFK